MNDSELQKLQDMIANKLTEVGLSLAAPITFMATVGGPHAVQMVAIIDDPAKLALRTQDELDMEQQFAAIAQQAEVERRAEKDKELELARLTALVEHSVITQEQADHEYAAFCARLDNPPVAEEHG